MRRKIAVVTGTRAEYSLLYWLMKEIEADDALELQLLVTAMHLSPEFGSTYRDIEADGFTINAKVEMLISGDTAVSVSKSLGLGTIGFADAYEQLQPDVVVILGDRFEMLAATQAAAIANIPIAHIHGGEVTEGAVDDAIRHAITKFSSLHFVAANEYGRRVIQMGERPDSVYDVGALGLDAILRTPPLSRETLEQELGLDLARPIALVTYHPVTRESEDPTPAMSELLTALEDIPQLDLLITYPNADAGGRRLIKQIESYAAENPSRVTLVPNLGRLRYYSLLPHVAVVVGNSSSGIIEVPFFHKPTVNIGHRQAGRLRAKSVLDCDENRSEIVKAVQQAMSMKFQAGLTDMKCPYGNGDASRRIVEILREIPSKQLKKQAFYDLPSEEG